MTPSSSKFFCSSQERAASATDQLYTILALLSTAAAARSFRSQRRCTDVQSTPDSEKLSTVSRFVTEVLISLGEFRRRTTSRHVVDRKGRAVLEASYEDLTRQVEEVTVEAVVTFNEDTTGELCVAVGDLLRRKIPCRRITSRWCMEL